MSERANRSARCGISVSTVRLIILCSLLLAGGALSGERTQMRQLPTPAGMQLAGDADPRRSKVYIVQLASPPAATLYRAAPIGVSAKPGGTFAQPIGSFDKHSAAVTSHVNRLADEHTKVLASVRGAPQKIYDYQYALNGFAAKMTAAQADQLRSDKRVLRVWEDEIRPLATRTSPSFLGLFDGQDGLRGALGLDGEGVVIGIIDSGIAPNHPSLQDTRESDRPGLCRSAWAQSSLLGQWLCRRFTVQEDVLDFEPQENWNGVCETGAGFTAEDCNNKVIGARFFVDGAQASLPIDPGDLLSPADIQGHGTHVATIAAGNKTGASIFGTALGNVQGVAPRARIAVYKACWVRSGDTSATCNTSDLANAIDTAVADGVHIINYSVGSSLIDAIAPDDIALINAAKAGVLTAVAAGNEGPNLATIGSPAGNPAVITVAASSRDGAHSLEAMQVKSPASVAARYAVREASFTPALQDTDPLEAELVLVDDNIDVLPGGAAGTVNDGCEALVNSSEITGTIAFVQRGGCNFDLKVRNAADAGAIAVVVFNIAGNPIVMTGTSGLSDIPALMIGQADGNLLLDELNAGQVVEVVLDKGLLLSQTDQGNIMGSFSARGPGPVGDILKPDVTAPGVNILAGATPDSITSAPGESFAFLSGTSMAAPHVAGVAALLRQAHPDWSPAAIKSALMTTARQDIKQQDGQTDAHPFDFGSGHIVPNSANDPGLVYEVSGDEYDAYSCGMQSPAVDQARCDQLVADGRSLLPVDLNQPAIAISRLANEQTVTRHVRNASDTAETYVAEVMAPTGTGIQVVPTSLSLAPGQTGSFAVTVSYLSGTLDLWRFGSLTWKGNDHSVRTPIAIRPTSISAPAEVASFGGTGSLSFPVEFGYNGAYSPGVHGLKRALVVNGFVEQDPTRTFTFRTNNGVTAHFLTVSPDQAYVRFILRDEFTDGDDDLDMYVYYSPDGNSFTRIGQSGEFNSDEEFSLLQPAAGTYGIFVHGFATDSSDAGGPGSNYKLLAWEFGFNDDAGNMTATGPTFVNAGSTENVTVNWSNLGTDSIYLGGISHNTPQGIASFTIVSIRN
jgi:subtilisin family serine protease